MPFDGTNGMPAYRHPGGMQIMGDVLAIGAENPFGPEDPAHRATILFFDISDPEHPRLISRFDPPDLSDPDNAEFGADPVGLTAIRGEDGTCCRFLLIVAGGPANKDVRFFRSRVDPGTSTTNLKSPSLAWDLAGSYTESELEACPGMSWPEGSGPFNTGAHQMLNFVREGELDGQLYLIGGRRTGALPNPDAEEKLDLYEVNLFDSGIPKTCPLTFVRSKLMGRVSWGGFTVTSSFTAGSGVYVSPSGELIVYATNHAGSAGNSFVFGEYRIGAFVRANSPTLRPTAQVDGPFVVDEGSTVTLTGSGAAPITKAFIQLFSNTDVALEGTTGAWFPIEYGTRNDDSFDQFDRLGFPANDIDEAASSWRWFAPPGCTISVNDYPRRSDEFPGPDTIQLRGTVQFQEELDLSSLDVYTPDGSPYPVSPVPAGQGFTTRNYNDDIGGVTFYGASRDGDGNLHTDSGCDDYYNAAFSLGWDLDGNGSFEAAGEAVDFNAAALDGPFFPNVRARAKHPTDTSSVGTGAPLTVPIEVRNVAPSVSASATDALGNDLGGGLHPAILGLPVRLAASFTDPGRLDTQTASIDWGDGSPLDTSFGAFSDARGGTTGVLNDTHIFTTPGNHNISVSVTDDDGGSSAKQIAIRVVSLEDAIAGTADQLTQLIAGTTNTGIASALRNAREELIGNLGGRPPTNGAIDKLDRNDPASAITKVKAAIAYLAIAEARGAGDLTAFKDLLGLVAEGIAVATYQQVEAALPSPLSPKEAKALTEAAALLASGRQQLAARQYPKACDNFRAATVKAMGIR